MIVEQKSNRIASDCTWQRNTDHTLLPIVQQTNEQNGVRHKHKWLLHHNEISNAFNMHWWHIFFRINFGVSTPRKLGVWRVWFHHCMETVCNEDVVEWPGPRELWVPRFKFWVGLILTFSKESGQPFQCSKHSCKAKKLSHSGADQWDQDCPSIVPSCFGYHQLIWLMLPVLWQKVQCPCLCLFCACFTEMWGFLLMWPVPVLFLWAIQSLKLLSHISTSAQASNTQPSIFTVIAQLFRPEIATHVATMWHHGKAIALECWSPGSHVAMLEESDAICLWMHVKKVLEDHWPILQIVCTSRLASFMTHGSSYSQWMAADKGVMEAMLNQA